MMLVAEGTHEECNFEVDDGNVDSDENDETEANEEDDYEDSDDGDEEDESSMGEEEDLDEGEESDSDGVTTTPSINMDQKPRRPELRVGEGEEEDDDSDDDVPAASSLSAGRDTVEAEEKKVKQEVQRLKEKVREDRKRRHERNKLQQAEKRQRVASLAKIARMPENLLDAVVAEQKTEAKRRAGEARQGKHTTFDGGDDDDGDGCNEDNEDEGGIVPLQQGVQVQTLKQQEEKLKTLSQKAAEFKQNRLYGPRLNRMKSSQLQNIKLKQQQKGGRGVNATR